MPTCNGYIEYINPMEVDYGPGMRILISLNSVDYKIELTSNQLVDRIRKFRPYITVDGGVTFIGDIDNQIDFVLEELKLCRKSGIKTCIRKSDISADSLNSLKKHIDIILN